MACGAHYNFGLVKGKYKLAYVHVSYNIRTSHITFFFDDCLITFHVATTKYWCLAELFFGTIRVRVRHRSVITLRSPSVNPSRKL
jgi:hypothetical protein